MRLRDLRLDDFGCFRNARLEGLDDSLVVVGGPQRAGKTTFMQALRQFPDGVDRGGDLPPATETYRVDAEVSDGEHRYRFVLRGHAAPSISPIHDGPDCDSSDLFGAVTERQFRNLYTISLDELRRLPPGVEDSEDLARILLGGAYGDIAAIPEVEATFADRADAIGLTRGDPKTTTSRLHEPYRTVREGIEERTAASRQVDEHSAVTDELEDVRAEQSEVEAEIARRQQRRDRLNVLEELFDPLERIDELSARLAEVDRATVEAFPTHLTDRLDRAESAFETATAACVEARRAFDREVTVDAPADYDAWLLAHEQDVDGFTERRALWSQTAEQLAERRAALDDRRREIEREIATLHPAWDESFTHVEESATSALDRAQVSDLASTVEDLAAERDDLEASIAEDRSRIETLEADLAEMDERGERGEASRAVDVPTRTPGIVAGIAIVLGAVVGFATDPLVGGALALAVLAVGLYAIDATVTVETDIDPAPVRELKSQVATLESDVAAARRRREDVEAELAERREELAEVVSALGLPDGLPPGEVPDVYGRVVELDEEIAAYRADRDDWETDRQECRADLEAVAALLSEPLAVSWTPDDPLADAEDLLSTLSSVADHLELAREVRRAERERADAVDEIDTVFAEWAEGPSVDADDGDERVRRAVREFRAEAERVEPLAAAIEEREQLRRQVRTRLDTTSATAAFESLRTDGEPWPAVVRAFAETYADTDAITDEIREQRRQIETLEDRREELRETCLELESRQDELAAEDDLQAARAKIDAGRVEFERLGEAYAVNRIAEAMVGDLHERLLADVVDSLVDDASAIFSEITGEYAGIELEGGVQDLQFRARREGAPDHGVGELSRATAEQLFLAVRLARIRQTDVSLPVVLDDAATNFDPGHMRRVYDVVDELTESTQVFVLTCHPQCVRLAASDGRSPQYWFLEDGNFAEASSAADLERRLTAD